MAGRHDRDAGGPAEVLAAKTPAGCGWTTWNRWELVEIGWVAAIPLLGQPPDGR